MKNVKKASRYFKKAKEFGHSGVNAEMLQMLGMLSQLDPMEHQRETDMR